MAKGAYEHQGVVYGMGRIPSHFDIRNMDYAIRDKTDMKPPKDNTWDTKGPILNQGSTPQCTGHGARAWEMITPIEDPVQVDETGVPDPRATAIWRNAQIVEFGHTDPNDGATIHGIAKALSDPSITDLCSDGKPRIKEYIWAFSMDEIISFVANEGPMIIGVSWYKSMFETDSDGVMRVDPQSGLAGGHCVCIRGVQHTKQLVGPIPNSWGTQFAKQGEFYLPYDQFQLLLPGGEFLAALEQPL